MEKQKTDPILMVAAAVALIATVYVFYITVVEQIVGENQGYFYAVVFAFILLVLFLLCNLFTKLIAISVGGQRSPYRRLVITIGMVVLAGLFLVTRMRYSTSLYPGDYPIYRGAVAMIEGNYAQSHDLIESANANPAQYLCSVILSIFFRISEPGPKPFLWMNAIFIIISGLLTYMIVRTFTNQLCGFFAGVLCAFVPSQTFAVYSFTSETMVTAIYLGATFTLISLFSYNKRVKEKEEYGEADKKDIAGTVFTVVGALLIGMLIFIEPFMIIPSGLMVVVAYISRKMKALNMLLAFVGGILITVVLCFAKASSMEVDFGTVMTGEMSAFDPTTDYNSGKVYDFSEVFDKFNVELSSTDKNIIDNYRFIADEKTGAGAYTDMSASWVLVLNQIMYMFLLMMTISCMVLAVKEQKDYVVTISMLIVGAFLMLLFQQNRDNQKFLFVTIFIIATATGIHYLYLDHHPELKVSVNALDALEKTGRKEIAAATRTNLKNAAQMTEADFVKRAKALIFVGNDEELYQRIKNEEHERSLKYMQRPEKGEESFDDYDEDFFLDSEDDSADQVKVTAVAPSGIRQTVTDESAYEPNAEMHESASEAYNNTSVPAWKRPEKFGDEVMFDEDDVELDKAHSSFDGRETLDANAGVTTKEPAPSVEKVKRNAKKVVVTPAPKKQEPLKINDELLEMPGFADDVELKELESPEEEPVIDTKGKKLKARKADKVKKEKESKLATKPASTTMSGGKAVRRIKNVGTGAAAISVGVPKAAEIKPSEPIPNPLPVPKKKDHKAMDYDKKVKTGAEDDWDFDYDVSEDDDWDV